MRARAGLAWLSLKTTRQEHRRTRCASSVRCAHRCIVSAAFVCSMGESDCETDEESPMSVDPSCQESGQLRGCSADAADPSAVAPATAAAAAHLADATTTATKAGTAADGNHAVAASAGAAPLSPPSTTPANAPGGAAPQQVGHAVALCPSREKRMLLAFTQQPDDAQAQLRESAIEALCSQEALNQQRIQPVMQVFRNAFDVMATDPEDFEMAMDAYVQVGHAVKAAVLANTGHEGAGQSDMHSIALLEAFDEQVLGSFGALDGAIVSVTRHNVAELWAEVDKRKRPGARLNWMLRLLSVCVIAAVHCCTPCSLCRTV